MTHQDPPAATGPTPSGGPPRPSGGPGSRSAWAAGGALFAGMMLIIGGVLAILEGIVGIAQDAVYVTTRGDYTYKFDVRAWGWIHLVLGVVAVLIGYGLLSAAAWARYAGMLIAGLSLVANFMFLPYQPVWSIVMIAIDIFVIWALATHHPANAPAGGLR
jgi:hypothetical protein